jgi:hypothetical protein
MAHVHKSTPVAPSTSLLRQPYLRSKIHDPGTQVNFGRTFKPALAAIVPWVWNPWFRYLSPVQWHKSMLTVAPKPTPVAQPDNCAILRPLRRWNYSFSLIFHLLWLSEKCFSSFHLKSTPCGTKLTIVIASKVCFARQLKSTSVFMSHLKSPLRAAQSWLRFSSRIWKSAPRGTKSTSVFKSHSKVRTAGI